MATRELNEHEIRNLEALVSPERRRLEWLVSQPLTDTIRLRAELEMAIAGLRRAEKYMQLEAVALDL